MIRRPPRSTRTDTLFPYTTLFRSSRFPLQVPFPVDNVTGIGLQPDAVGVELWLRTDPPIPSVVMPSDPRGEVCGHVAGASSASATNSVRRNFLSSSEYRSEERRVGKECVSTCRSRWSPYHEKKK